MQTHAHIHTHALTCNMIAAASCLSSSSPVAFCFALLTTTHHSPPSVVSGVSEFFCLGGEGGEGEGRGTQRHKIHQLVRPAIVALTLPREPAASPPQIDPAACRPRRTWRWVGRIRSNHLVWGTRNRRGRVGPVGCASSRGWWTVTDPRGGPKTQRNVMVPKRDGHDGVRRTGGDRVAKAPLGKARV